MADFSPYNGASAEWLAFSAALPKTVLPPPTATTADLLALQAGANNAVAALGTPKMAKLAPKLLIKDHNIPARPGSAHTIPARSYQPLSTAYKDAKPPCYIHFHGGGFMYGTLAADDADCSDLALKTNLLVISVQYRHTPEYTYPAAWDDAADAVSWVLDGAGAEVLGVDRDRIVVGGSSAGAWLTSSTVLGRKIQGKNNVAGQLLMIPAVVRLDCYEPVAARLKDEGAGSMRVNADVEEFGMRHLKFYTDLLKFPPRSDESMTDLVMNPGLATTEDAKGLPPTVMGIAGLDPLRDEGLLYGKTLAEAGVPTKVNVFPGVAHPFRMFHEHLSEGKRSQKMLVDAFPWIFSKPAPTNNFVVDIQ